MFWSRDPMLDNISFAMPSFGRVDSIQDPFTRFLSAGSNILKARAKAPTQHSSSKSYTS
jgi:hypothetical protein